MTLRYLSVALLVAACPAPKKNGAASSAPKPVGPSHGEYASSIDNVRGQLQKTPCDKQLALKLGDYLNRAKDYAGADAWVEEFEKSCERWPRLLWVRQHACEQLDNHDCASKTAGALIASRPSDSDYWWWRGQAEARLEHWTNARADDFQSMANKPTGFPAYRLAQFADEKLQRPCDGALLIQWWIDHGKRTDEEWIDQARSKLWLAGSCGKSSGKGRAFISARLNAPAISVKVKLDKIAANFVLDEHAGTSVVSAAVAKQAGLQLQADAPKVQVLAGGELHEGPIARVKALSFAGATANEIDVVVLDTLPEGVDGLIGLNALMQFQVKRTPKGFELASLP